jgi:hypothetical protein
MLEIKDITIEALEKGILQDALPELCKIEF